MPKEIWKPVVGYEKSYAVSNLGRVKSLVGRFGFQEPPKILKPFFWGNYWAVHLSLKSTVRKWRVHELVLRAFVSRRPRNRWCRHLDGNIENNTLTNLKWGTAEENEADKILHGKTIYGERNGNGKLTEDQVNQIRQIPYTEMSRKQIAEKFGISTVQVTNIRKGYQWKHV